MTEDTATHPPEDPPRRAELHTADVVGRDARAAAELVTEVRTHLARLDTALTSLASRIDTWPNGYLYAGPLYNGADAVEVTLGRLPEIERTLAYLRDAAR